LLQDRKHQAEIARLEKQQLNQAAVLRRKAEEAAAANNRLKDLMQKQKVVNENKAKRQQQADASNIGTRIRVGILSFICYVLKINVTY